jgi:hypothetical protein
MSKVAIFTVGAWASQIDKLAQKLSATGSYAGKFSSDERLLDNAQKGGLTHVLAAQEVAFKPETVQKLKGLGIKIVSFKDAGILF